MKGSIGDLFPGKEVAFDSATLYYINASQSYSNSGKSYLYDMNSCYDKLHPYTIELDTITISMNEPDCDGVTDNSCITVPAYSVGYFTVQLKTSPLKEYVGEKNELIIYPNPANNYLHCTSIHQAIKSVRIINDLGQVIIDEMYPDSGVLDISYLTFGHYIIIADTSDGEKLFSQFAKQ